MLIPRLLVAEMESRLIGDSAYRCGRCGGGPVQMLGGNLGTLCLNCSSHRSSEPLFDFSVREIFKTVGRWFTGLGQRRKERRHARRAKNALCFSTEGIF